MNKINQYSEETVKNEESISFKEYDFLSPNELEEIKQKVKQVSKHGYIDSVGCYNFLIHDFPKLFGHIAALSTVLHTKDMETKVLSEELETAKEMLKSLLHVTINKEDTSRSLKEDL